MKQVMIDTNPYSGEEKKEEELELNGGCRTWIRTMTSRFRDCCATVTPSGKIGWRENIKIGFGVKQPS
tara:strand:+ start:216 stop:419 length:204 start_codon:yes stop_codon:yes gene_type:complete